MRKPRIPLLPRLRISTLRQLRRFQRSKLGVRSVDCCYFGAEFHVNLNDVVGYDIAIKRFEYYNLTRFLAACRSCRPSICIDAGANLGVYTCVAGVNTSIERLMAFEPDPENFSALERHVARNGLQARTQVFRAALGAQRGQVRLTDRDPLNSGLVSVLDGDEGAPVPLLALDDVLPLKGDNVVVKMDVEGYEDRVLAGAEALLRNNGGYAQIEAPGERAAPVIARMTNAGWRLCDHAGLDLMFER